MPTPSFSDNGAGKRNLPVRQSYRSWLSGGIQAILFYTRADPRSPISGASARLSLDIITNKEKNVKEKAEG